MAELTIADIDFLQGRSADEIHQEMLNSLPEELDKTEGGLAWDFTRPTALQEAKFAEEEILKALSCIFPMYAFGQWLDYHGEMRSITRKDPTFAQGEIQVTGLAGTEVQEGARFSTVADDFQQYVEFEALETIEIESAEETYTIPVKAVVSGVTGNVSAHTVVAMSTNINGISSVDNALPITGGTELESDDDLRIRILEFDRNRSASYVGSVADYKRWASEVNGVGHVEVIPAQDTSGTVTLIITDSNGEPANEALLTAVYNHIERPDSPEERLTNVNAVLSVVAPEAETITISAVVEPIASGMVETIKTAFIANLKRYFLTAGTEIKYTMVGRVLSETEGVNDYKNLTVNGGTANISLTNEEMPIVTSSSVTLTEGTV